jgi:hypothetical protein
MVSSLQSADLNIILVYRIVSPIGPSSTIATPNYRLIATADVIAFSQAVAVWG